MASVQHYDEKYFRYQGSIGEFGGWANLSKFNNYISTEDDVIDFGCGGGYLLKNLRCREKIGVEINAVARAQAIENGILCYETVEQVPDECASVIVSNHALEHVHEPLAELRKLRRTLRDSGRIILVVPCDDAFVRWEPNDINRHLYSWSPMCLGNLLTEAEFRVVDVKPYVHKWPPGYANIAKWGRRWFDFRSKLYGHLHRSNAQVRAVACKS